MIKIVFEFIFATISKEKTAYYLLRQQAANFDSKFELIQPTFSIYICNETFYKNYVNLRLLELRSSPFERIKETLQSL